jgi:flagellar export protein FliJ
MKPFRFGLEAVATVRKRIEGEALESYAQALLVRQQALKQFETIQCDLTAAWDQLRRELGMGCPAARMTRLRGHAEALNDERKLRETALQQSERAVHQSLQRMLAARQQREVVEKFRSRQRAHHDRDVASETQKFLDELATQRSTPALAGRITTDPLA